MASCTVYSTAHGRDVPLTVPCKQTTVDLNRDIGGGRGYTSMHKEMEGGGTVCDGFLDIKLAPFVAGGERFGSDLAPH